MSRSIAPYVRDIPLWTSLCSSARQHVAAQSVQPRERGIHSRTGEETGQRSATGGGSSQSCVRSQSRASNGSARTVAISAKVATIAQRPLSNRSTSSVCASGSRRFAVGHGVVEGESIDVRTLSRRRAERVRDRLMAVAGGAVAFLDISDAPGEATTPHADSDTHT